jgi:hypothetical protein
MMIKKSDMKLVSYNKKLVYFGILVIFLIPFAFAVPPVTTTQQFTTGYTIQEPQDNILKLNGGYNFDFHVYNISNGVPKIKDISCMFHLYNQTGSHILISSSTIPTSTFDYEFLANADNFTSLGAYYYNIQCNSTDLGGYATSVVYVTNTGEANPAGIVLIFFFAGFILILGFLIYIIIYSFGHFMKKDFDFNDLSFNLGIYFALFAFYVLHTHYFGDSIINSVLDVLIIVGAFTNVFFPFIFLIISMIWNSMDANRRASEYE